MLIRCLPGRLALAKAVDELPSPHGSFGSATLMQKAGHVSIWPKAQMGNPSTSRRLILTLGLAIGDVIVMPPYTGRDADGVAQTEAYHFMKCPTCGEWFDMHDLGQVLAHVHDAKIEIVEVPMPPREKPLQ